MSCIEMSNERIKQLNIHNHDLGDVLQEIVALTNIMVDTDFASMKASSQHQFFVLLDGKVLDAVAIHDDLSKLLAAV